MNKVLFYYIIIIIIIIILVSMYFSFNVFQLAIGDTSLSTGTNL